MLAALDSRRAALAAVVVLVAAAAVSTVALARPGRGGCGGGGRPLGAGAVVVPVEERCPLPAFSGPTLEGGQLDLASFRGQMLVLNFWASWCGPCHAEQAALEQASGELRARGVHFVGVDVRDRRVAAAAFLDQYGVTYPSLFDEGAALAQRLGGQGPIGPPYTLVVDRQGRIGARMSGLVGSTAAQVAQLRDAVGAVDR